LWLVERERREGTGLILVWEVKAAVEFGWRRRTEGEGGGVDDGG
jgi:hypothetical protein